MTTFTIQRKRCICELGGEATHRIHGMPSMQTGKHMDPRCPHSELYNTLIKYPNMRKRKAEKRTYSRPMARNVGS